jgi:hypothetical protein
MRFYLLALFLISGAVWLTGCGGSALAGSDMVNAVQVADDSISLDENGRVVEMNQEGAKEQ